MTFYNKINYIICDIPPAMYISFKRLKEIFNKYVGKKITFVEVGVLHGGSLFMWREYFGKEARIIGIDLHPKAKELEKLYDIFFTLITS